MNEIDKLEFFVPVALLLFQVAAPSWLMRAPPHWGLPRWLRRPRTGTWKDNSMTSDGNCIHYCI